jgi:hypothetical protein
MNLVEWLLLEVVECDAQVRRLEKQANLRFAGMIEVAKLQAKNLRAAAKIIGRLEWLEQQDGCALVNDDQGSWAFASTGSQSLSENPPDDCDTAFFIPKADWKPTIAEALDYAIKEEEDDDDA